VGLSASDRTTSARATKPGVFCPPERDNDRIVIRDTGAAEKCEPLHPQGYRRLGQRAGQGRAEQTVLCLASVSLKLLETTKSTQLLLVFKRL
jgi:hypothetical protein